MKFDPSKPKSRIPIFEKISFGNQKFVTNFSKFFFQTLWKYHKNKQTKFHAQFDFDML